MRLGTELALTVAGLVALNLLLVFGAVGLFVRMGPAIERILQENDSTIVAAEEILATVAARQDLPISDDERARIDDAMRRAKNNITEPQEGPILVRIEAALENALDGSAPARAELVTAIRRLIDVNRAAMGRVDLDAQRLGKAGAWSAVFVGLVTLGLSLLIVSRLGTRLVRPLAELRQVLQAVRSGDPFRRCGSHRAAHEVQQVLSGVNSLLDRCIDPEATAPDRVP